MLLLTAYVECGPENRDALRAAAAVLAASTREEAGCIEYNFYENTEEPGRFVFVELWRDNAALEAHFAAPHLADFVRVSAPLLTGRHGTVYEVDEGRKL